MTTSWPGFRIIISAWGYGAGLCTAAVALWIAFGSLSIGWLRLVASLQRVPFPDMLPRVLCDYQSPSLPPHFTPDLPHLGSQLKARS